MLANVPPCLPRVIHNSPSSYQNFAGQTVELPPRPSNPVRNQQRGQCVKLLQLRETAKFQHCAQKTDWTDKMCLKMWKTFKEMRFERSPGTTWIIADLQRDSGTYCRAKYSCSHFSDGHSRRVSISSRKWTGGIGKQLVIRDRSLTNSCLNSAKGILSSSTEIAGGLFTQCTTCTVAPKPIP